MKNKIYLLLLFIIVMSCDKQNSLEEVLITKPNEAWLYYSPISADFTYFKFEKNHFCNRYERDSENKFFKYRGPADSPEGPEKWIVTNDSILKWGMFVYDIASYNENVIVLYCQEANIREKRMVFLIKEKENNPRKNSGIFEQKRIDHPEKYKKLSD